MRAYMVCCIVPQGVGSPARRAELFAAYIEALRQVAAQRMAKAEAALTQLLVKLNVAPESSWEEVRSSILHTHCFCSNTHVVLFGRPGRAQHVCLCCCSRTCAHYA
jgi:hypothetical protein